MGQELFPDTQTGNGDETTFEKAFARLEEVVRRLESGEAELEESLALFEEGVKLSRVCAQRLDQAETKIKILLENESGAPEERPFDPDPGSRDGHG